VSGSGRWWEAGDYTRCLGVFQGGGAKGAAYAGALQGVAEREYWFSEVAGASAGAITAALVASGAAPDELEGLGTAGLSKLRWRLIGVLTGQAKALLDNSELGAWLEGELHRRVTGFGVEVPDRVTFAQLERATGIRCHVVVLDLATTAPIVFCAASTPNASVTDAVLASSAIPAALDPGRAVIPQRTRPSVTHHLTDGGGWANLPTFVFRDEAWRRWAFGPEAHAAAQARADYQREFWTEPGRRRHDLPEGRLLCFTLNPKDDVEHVRPLGLLSHADRSAPQFDLGTGRTARSFPVVTASWVLGSSLRVIPLVAVVVAAILFVDRIPEALLDFNEVLRSDTGPLWPLLFAVGTIALLLGSALATGLFLALFGIGLPLSLSVLPAIRATLSVATSPPPWTGAHENSTHIAIPVKKLTTLSFTAPADDAIAEGRRVALAALADTTDAQAAPPAPIADPPPAHKVAQWVDSGLGLTKPLADLLTTITAALDRLFARILFRRGAGGGGTADRERLLEIIARRVLGRTMIAVVTLGAVSAGITALLMQTARGEGWLWSIGALVLAGAIIFLGVLALQAKALDRATGEAKRITPLMAAGFAAGLALAAGVTIWAGLEAADVPAERATIVRVAADGDAIRYRAQVGDERPVVLRSSISLGVRERVLMRTDGEPRLYGFPEPVWFIVSAVSGLIFFGALLFGADELRYPSVRARLEASIAAHTAPR
jgi:predicted acylesterase/phospholipase RssA